MNLSIQILLLFFPGSVSMSAQIARTSLIGTVTDQQGKRIPSAKMHATNTSTGFRREIETNACDAYVLLNRETGTFSIEIWEDGFAPLRFRSVQTESRATENPLRHFEPRRARRGDERHRG